MKAVKYRALAPLLAVSCLLALAPSPLLAATPVKIVLGGSGATPWEISGIVPGMSGTEVVTVQNGGTAPGDLTVWISEIVNTEGTPVSIQPDADAEGDLGDYLTFEIESTRVSTNITMPVLITGLPQSAADSNYVRVLSMAPGETVTLNWNWSLPPETGNPAQGDSLSFTINYVLEQIPTVRPPRPTSPPAPRPSEGYVKPDPYVPPPTPTPTPTPTATSTPTPTPTPTPTATTTVPPTTPPDYQAEGLPFYYWLLLPFAGGVGFMLLFLGRRRRKKDEEQ